jgi:ribonuclease BN (tRNA processing enzyme)
MSKITILGSASGAPVPGRAHACFVLEAEHGSYLFDAGEGCAASLVRHGIDHDRIFHVFITHMHPDHVIGLPMLLQMMHLRSREIPLTVSLPAEAVETTRDYLRTLYLLPGRLSFELQLEPIRPNPIYRDEAIVVSAFQNHHLMAYGPQIAEDGLDNQMQSYSMGVLADGKKLYYSGDVRDVRDIAEVLSEPDVAVTECMHVPPEELMNLLAEKKVPRAVLTHVPPELENKDAYLLQLAEKHGVNDVLVAHDGLSLHL